MGLPHRQKKCLYLLITILEDPIAYRGGIINLKIGPIQLTIKGRKVKMSFNILPLGKDKVILRMPQLQKYNLKINWVIGQVILEIYNNIKCNSKLKQYSTRLE